MPYKESREDSQQICICFTGQGKELGSAFMVLRGRGLGGQVYLPAWFEILIHTHKCGAEGEK